MSIFAAYDSEFSALSQDINKNISDIKSCSSNALLDISTSSAYCDEKKSNSLVKHVDALLIQAGDLIKQMEVEIRSHDAATRKVLSGKVSEYKKSLALLKAEYERTREESQRAALLGSSSSASQDRYATVNGKLKRQNESIANAHRSVAETEDVALEITQELNRNREKIKSAHSKVAFYTAEMKWLNVVIM